MRLKLLLIAALAITALTAPAAASARTYGLGCEVPQNAESHPARLAGALSTLPASYSLQQYALVPGDQGQVGSCAAWGTAYTAMGVLVNMDHSQGIWDNPLNALPGGGGSAMYVYSQTCGGVDNGSYIDDDVAVETSQGDDEDADYTQGELDWWDPPTSQETANAKNWVLATGYDIGTDQYSIEQAISNNEPVVLGIEVTQAFESNTSGNYPDPNDPDDDYTSLGGHAPTAVGYDSGGLIVENSWGPYWDNGGYVHISWDWLEGTYQDSGWPDLTQAVAMVSMSHYYAPAPTITSFAPTSGPVGATVTLTGSGFSGASKVTFDGCVAGFSVDSDTQISATVPGGATSGAIAVTTPGGGASSATSFTVTALSADDSLKSLTVSAGSLSPSFSSGTLSYSDSVANSVASITVSATTNDAKASYVLQVFGSPASNPIELSLGANVIKVLVSAQSGASKTYSLTVTRAAALITPHLTLKLSGLISGALKLGKRLTAKGSVMPTSLAGAKVTLAVQRKVGGKWRKVISVAHTVAASGAYGWKYKPAKKGSYRIRATIAKTAANTAAATKWNTFKVK